jgi:hypothetical protein
MFFKQYKKKYKDSRHIEKSQYIAEASAPLPHVAWLGINGKTFPVVYRTSKIRRPPSTAFWGSSGIPYNWRPAL